MNEIEKKVSQITIPTKLHDTVERFLAALDASHKTKDTYRKALRVFTIWITDKAYTNPTRENILEYKEYLRGKTVVNAYGELKELSPLTVTAYLTALRRFFTYLEGEKIYPNIAKDIKGLKKPKGHLKNALTKHEVNRLLESIQEETLNALRDYAIINLMLRTGMRTIEVSRALVGDIDTKSGETVLRVLGKGRDSKDEYVILTEKTYKPILDYFEKRGSRNPKEPLFASHSNRNKAKSLSTRSIRRIVETRLRAVGLKTSKISSHSLRHTAGTTALENGADIVSVQSMLRHSNINTTMIYVHDRKRIENGAEKFIDF